MAVKLLFYFIFAFFGIFVFLLVQQPYVFESNSGQIKDQADIEMLTARSYAITPQGVTRVADAKKVLRYSNYDRFETINVLRQGEDEFTEALRSDKGRLEKNTLTLSGDVHYKNSDNVQFYSQEVKYDLDTKVAKSDGPFVLKDDRSIIDGKALVYETQEGKIYAQNIESTTKVE